jgi:hypothetical protein
MPETKSRKGIGGPNTKEGKERIRLNALKMGLYANSIEGMQAVAAKRNREHEARKENVKNKLPFPSPTPASEPSASELRAASRARPSCTHLDRLPKPSPKSEIRNHKSPIPDPPTPNSQISSLWW